MNISSLRESIFLDLRYAMRGFRRNPVFTATVIVTIMLGIGASTAVFSVVDRILFRALPYPGDNRLVAVGMTAPIEQQEFILGNTYLDWRDHQTPFESMTSWSGGVGDCDLTERDPMRIACARVESNFLPTFGIQPILGRSFGAEEDRPNGAKVALLSYALWKSRFGGDPAIPGKVISVDGQSTTILGVLPATFELPTLASADLLLPQALDEARQRAAGPAQWRVLRAFARMKPGVSIEQARAQLQPLFDEMLKGVPPHFRNEVKLSVRSLRDRQVHDTKLMSWILLAAVFSVLLIACGNVVNLLLARSPSRLRDLAVRAALGAGRLRLIRQALTESLLMGVAGGIAGGALAYGLLRVLISSAPQGIPRLQQASIDLRVLCFTLAISLLSGISFGLAPALRELHSEDLTGKRAVGFSRGFARQALVAGQIAISLILLTAAALLLRTLWKIESEPLGMDTENVLTADIALGVRSYPDPPRQLAFYENLERRLQSLPGLQAFALSSSLPLGRAYMTLFAGIQVEGRPRFSDGTGGQVLWRAVTPGYFPALGIPIVRGRGFREEDRGPNENVLILSELLAGAMFPGEDPTGRRLQLGLQGPWMTVVGIAGNVKNGGIDRKVDPEYYVVRKHTAEDRPFRAPNSNAVNVVLRTAMNPKAMAEWFRSEIRDLDPTLPVNIESMQQRVSKVEARPRFNAVLLSLFAGVGVLLSGIGLYGVIAFLVAQRTPEIGVRMALGASPGNIEQLVLTQAMRWTIAGATLGAIGAFFVGRLLSSLLFGTHPEDPLALGTALLALFSVALTAAWIPSRRAAKIDPLAALRQE